MPDSTLPLPAPPSSSQSIFSRGGSVISVETAASTTNQSVSSSDAAVIVSEEDDRDDEDDEEDDNYFPGNYSNNNHNLPPALILSQRTTSLDQARQTQHHQPQQQHRRQRRRRTGTPRHLPQTSSPRRSSSSTRPRRKSSSRRDWMAFDRNEPDWDSSMEVVKRDDQVDGDVEALTLPSHQAPETTTSTPSPLELPFYFLCGGASPVESSPLARRSHRKEVACRDVSTTSNRTKSANRQTALVDDDQGKIQDPLLFSSRSAFFPPSLVPPSAQSPSLLALATKENSPPPPAPPLALVSQSSKLTTWSSASMTLEEEEHDETLPCLWNLPPPSPARTAAASRQDFEELQQELAHLRKRMKKKNKVLLTDYVDEELVSDFVETKLKAITPSNADSKRENVVMDCKSVRFAQPLVTQMQYRPKTTPDEICELFFQEGELEELELDRETTPQERFECVVVESASTHYHVAVKHNLARRRRDDEEESTTSSKASSKLSKCVTRIHI